MKHKHKNVVLGYIHNLYTAYVIIYMLYNI